jgi:hypothetical protein
MGSGWRLTPGGLDDRTKRPAGSHQRAVSRLTMVIFGSVLEAPRHHARRIAATVAHIEVGAVAAGYGVSATAISAISVAFTTTVVFATTIAALFILLAAIALSCRLILGRESAVWIAHAIART